MKVFSQKIGFLDKNDERFLLAVPYVGFALMFGYWTLTHLVQGFALDLDLARLMVALFFLDSIHVIYSLILVIALPELRKWTSPPREQKSRWNFWSKSLLVAFACSVGFYFLTISPLTRSIPAVLATFLMIEMLLPSQHIVSQLRGISFCYNAAIRQQSSFSPTDSARASKIEKNEKFLLKALLFSHVVYWTPRTLGQAGYPFAGERLLERIALVGLLGVSAAIIWNGSRYPHHQKSSKLIFLGRVLVYPLKALSYTASVMSRAIHGSEYLIIFRKMVKSSSLNEQKRKRVFLLAFGCTLLFAGVSILATPKLFASLTDWQQPRTLFTTMVLVQLVTRYVHYYMDRMIYRMSDAPTRAAVGPLLRAKTADLPMNMAITPTPVITPTTIPDQIEALPAYREVFSDALILTPTRDKLNIKY